MTKLYSAPVAANRWLEAIIQDGERHTPHRHDSHAVETQLSDIGWGFGTHRRLLGPWHCRDSTPARSRAI